MSSEKVLVTAAGPNMLPVLEQYSLPRFEEFASEQGYGVEVTALACDSLARKSDEAKHARWRKIALMREALQRHSIATWFDADVLICRTDEDIADHLGPDDYQGFVLHDVPAEDRINPNSGVWVMRQDPQSFRFLDAVEATGMPEGRWADQGAIMQTLGWVMGDERYHGARIPNLGSDFIPGTAWLPIG